MDFFDAGKITPITEQFEQEARQLVLNGLEKRFGFLDTSLNTDLNDILSYYSQPEALFLVGLNFDEVVCTGALTKETDSIGRIERMSVKKARRRSGLAGLMIKELERSALESGYVHLVLETSNDWHSAIEFYKKQGYQINWKDEERSHFVKALV